MDVVIEFVFILHLMREIMEITENLCQALQCKSQDILNAIHLVSTTKVLIQQMREIGWDPLFGNVKLFCEKHDIEIPDISAQYNAHQGRSQAAAHAHRGRGGRCHTPRQGHGALGIVPRELHDQGRSAQGAQAALPAFR